MKITTKVARKKKPIEPPLPFVLAVLIIAFIAYASQIKTYYPAASSTPENTSITYSD